MFGFVKIQNVQFFFTLPINILNFLFWMKILVTIYYVQYAHPFTQIVAHELSFKGTIPSWFYVKCFVLLHAYNLNWVSAHRKSLSLDFHENYAFEMSTHRKYYDVLNKNNTQ